jgi:glycerophosphoryl diester phosphodiesterase
MLARAMTSAPHAVFTRLRRLGVDGPVVTAHRGDSSRHPENTLPAFEAARAAGAAMQEFDVRSTRDGHLVCIHDAGVDRTTDGARVLGPGALVAQLTLAEIRRLDAGSWRGAEHTGVRVPTLADALAAMLPDSIPLIEHKAGAASAYVRELTRGGWLDACVLQSFDWAFVAEAKQLAPSLAVAVLGPTDRFAQPTDDALDQAVALGAGIVHWHDRALRRTDVLRMHARGLLVCTYTTDDEAGMLGGKALGFDAMCTNRPAEMLSALRSVRTAPSP